MENNKISGIFQLINPSNTIVANMTLSHAIGLQEAVIYSALIAKYSYYEKYNRLDKEGYFYSTIDDLQESTSLGRAAQKRAIDHLVELNLIHFKKKGLPAKRYFKINCNVNVLEKILNAELEKQNIIKEEKIEDKLGDKQVCTKHANCNDDIEQTGTNKTCTKTKENKLIKEEEECAQEQIEMGLTMEQFAEQVNLTDLGRKKDLSQEVLSIVVEKIKQFFTDTDQSSIYVNKKNMSREIYSDFLSELKESEFEFAVKQITEAELLSPNAIYTFLYNAKDMMKLKESNKVTPTRKRKSRANVIEHKYDMASLEKQLLNKDLHR